jgi:hypothetical protein
MKNKLNILFENNEDYYSNLSISNSSLGWLNISPKYFINKQNNLINEEKKSYFDLGTIVHSLILEENTFNEKYSVLDEKTEIPSSKQQKDLCEKIINGDIKDIEEAVIFYYYDVYSKNNKNESKIQKECLLFLDQFKNYIDFLLKSKNKIIISNKDYETANIIKYNLMCHKLAKLLLFDDFLNKNEKSFNEKEIYFEYKDIPCKSKIDRLIINENENKVKLIDLKTTSKPNVDFINSFFEYDYDRQLAFYKNAIDIYFNKFEIKEFEVYIIVCNTLSIYNNEVTVYKISNNLINSGKEKYEKLLKKYNLHLVYNNFDNTIEYIEGDGSILLDNGKGSNL